MSMVFLLEKDSSGTYRVKPVKAGAVPLIVCREESKLVLVSPLPATVKEIEAYAAKFIRDPQPPPSGRIPFGNGTTEVSPADVGTVGQGEEAGEPLDVLAESGSDDSDGMTEESPE